MVKPGKSGNSSRSAAGKKNRFSVYDFDFDDERVEKNSKKLLSKFKPRTPKISTSPVDKYSFLNFFAQGARIHENKFGNEPLDIEDSDDNMLERICTDSAVSSGCSNHKSSAHYPIDSKNIFPGSRSCILDDKKHGSRVSKIKLPDSSQPQILANNKPLYVDSDDDKENESFMQSEPISIDSDDDCRVESRLSISAPDLSKNGGSYGERPFNHGSSELDFEATVVINPDLIILNDMHCTNASLTFSHRSIKLEGSTFYGTKGSFSFDWSISDIVKIKSFWYRKVETAVVSLRLKCAREKAAEIDKKVSGIVELIFAVCDPQWPERQEAIKSLDMRYKAAWNNVVDIDPIWSEASFLEQKSLTSQEDCWSNSIEAFENIIYPQGDPDAVSICTKDIELLRPATFINDTIIDFYIKYLELKIKPEEKHRFHFFNSFFFRKLADLDKDPSTTCEGRAAFERVRKWTRKVNLFEKDYLFIPVNFSLHWSLIVICHPGEVAHFRDEEVENAFKVPCILHMNSIRGSHRGLKNLLQSYLWEEWRERHNELSEDVSTKFLSLLFVTPELPQQENLFDCGLFLLHYAERFLQQAPVNFSPFIRASNFLTKEWFPPAEASCKRGHIKKIIYRIVNSNAQKDPPATKDNYILPSVIEEGTGKEFLQEVCYGRRTFRGNYSAPNADEEIEITSPVSLRTSKESNLVPGNSLRRRDTARAVAERTHHYCAVNRSCNIMSPIQEEGTSCEQAAFSPTDKAGSGQENLRVPGSSLVHYDDVEPPFESSSGGFPTALSVQEEGSFVDEVILVSVSEERDENNGTSSMPSEELATFVVEDSEEEDVNPGIDDNGNPPSSESENFSMYDQELESSKDHGMKQNHLEP